MASDEPQTNALERALLGPSSYEWHGTIKGQWQFWIVHAEEKIFTMRQKELTFKGIHEAVSQQANILREFQTRRFLSRVCPHVLVPLSTATKMLTPTQYILEEVVDCDPFNLHLIDLFYSEEKGSLYIFLQQMVNALNSLFRAGFVLYDLSLQSTHFDAARKLFLLDPCPGSYRSIGEVGEKVELRKERAPPELMEQVLKGEQVALTNDKMMVYQLGLLLWERILGEDVPTNKRESGSRAEHDEFLNMITTRGKKLLIELNETDLEKQTVRLAVDIVLMCLQFAPEDRPSLRALRTRLDAFEQIHTRIQSYDAMMGPEVTRLRQIYCAPSLNKPAIAAESRHAPTDSAVEVQKLATRLAEVQSKLQGQETKVAHLSNQLDSLESEVSAISQECETHQAELAQAKRAFKTELEEEHKRTSAPASVQQQPSPSVSAIPDRDVLPQEQRGPTESVKARAKALLQLLQDVKAPQAIHDFEANATKIKADIEVCRTTLEEVSKNITQDIPMIGAQAINNGRDTATLKALLQNMLGKLQDLHSREAYHEIITSEERHAKQLEDAWTSYVAAIQTYCDTVLEDVQDKHNPWSLFARSLTALTKKRVPTFKYDVSKKMNRMKHIHYVNYGQDLVLHLLDLQSETVSVRRLEGVKQYFGFDSLQVRNMIYIAGGQDKPTSGKTYNTLLAVDVSHIHELPADKPLTIIHKANMIIAKYDIAFVKFNANHLFSIGGRAMVNGIKNYLVNCEQYSISNDKWTIIPSLNEPKCMVSACPVGRRFIYTFGGYRYEQTNVDSDLIERYDVLDSDSPWLVLKYNKEEWTACSGSGVIQINENEVLVFGGDSKSESIPLCVMFSLHNNTVKQAAPLNPPDEFHRRRVVKCGPMVYAISYAEHSLYSFSLETRSWKCALAEQWDSTSEFDKAHN